MLKAFKYRLYPNKYQTVLINKHFGCTRYIYNYGLNLKTSTYQKDKVQLHITNIITKLPKLKEDLPWLKEVNSQSL